MVKKKAKAKKGEFEWSSEIRRIIPLREDYVYISDEKGKLHHLKKSSDKYVELLKHLDAVMVGKITRELEALGWEDSLQALND